jgi:glycosyltransferase involved in cell wall biosynthesis
MKVLVFTSLYPNSVSPYQGVFIKERMTHFAKLDRCEIKVVAPVPYFPPVNLNWRWRLSTIPHLEVRDGLEVHHPRYFMTPKVGMTLYALTMFLSVLPTVRNVQRNFDFDLIDAHFVYPDGMAAVWLGRFFKKPVVVSARGSDVNYYSTFTLIRRFLTYTLNRADRVIAVSQALQRAIVELGVPAEKISVVPNGVNLRIFSPLEKADARRSLGLPQDRRVVLSVGHLTANKGFDLVIKAIRILLDKSQKKNLQLVIVGNGVVRAELQKLVSSLGLDDHVRLAGAVANEQLYRWYSAADVFCLASEQEGWPNVVLESLACGTPVVATRAGGIPEIISSDEVGLLTERNERDIAETLDRALKKSWQNRDLIQYARGQSWDRVSVALLRVFEGVQHRPFVQDLSEDSGSLKRAKMGK